MGWRRRYPTNVPKDEDYFIDKGVPVILGEYGAIRREELENDKDNLEQRLKSRAYYVEFVTREAKNYGMVPFYWDNGYTDFGIFDRKQNTVSDTLVLHALVSGAMNGKYPFWFVLVYCFSAKGCVI